MLERVSHLPQFRQINVQLGLQSEENEEEYDFYQGSIEKQLDSPHFRGIKHRLDNHAATSPLLPDQPDEEKPDFEEEKQDEAKPTVLEKSGLEEEEHKQAPERKKHRFSKERAYSIDRPKKAASSTKTKSTLQLTLEQLDKGSTL